MKLLLFTPTNFFEIFSASIRKMAVLQLSYSSKTYRFRKRITQAENCAGIQISGNLIFLRKGQSLEVIN